MPNYPPQPSSSPLPLHPQEPGPQLPEQLEFPQPSLSSLHLQEPGPQPQPASSSPSYPQEPWQQPTQPQQSLVSSQPQLSLPDAPSQPQDPWQQPTQPQQSLALPQPKQFSSYSQPLHPPQQQPTPDPSSNAIQLQQKPLLQLSPVKAQLSQPQKRLRNVPLWLFAIVLLWALSASIILGIHNHSTTTPQTKSVTSKATAILKATNTPGVTATPTTALPWQTVQTFSGNGNNDTAIFSVDGDWKLNWTCDLNSFISGTQTQYNVIVNLNASDGSMIKPGVVNVICKSGYTTGSTEQHQSGSVFLDVVSEAAWTLTVQELQ